MNKHSLIAALLLAWAFPTTVLAQAAPLLSISDPEGDDFGDGTLVYPRDSAFSAGDLDLRSLRVFAEGNDLRFEATFRNPVRDPGSARGPGLGSEDLSVFARKGFYAFNLDIYLDTDRVPGSGNTVSLPGRGATFDPAHGWEKAIVLTPRPELMKRQFTEALQAASPGDTTAVEATVARSVFFASEVRVRGRTVSFTVPGSFVNAKAVAGASLTALVTVAKLSIEVDANLLRPGPDNPLARLTLGAAQPEPGQPLLAMGYTGTRAPATAVVDLLSPDPRQQAAQLAPGALLTGRDAETKMMAAEPAAMPTPAASTAAPAAAAPGGSWFSRALGSVTGLFSSGAAPAAGAGAVTPAAAAAAGPQSVQSLMAPSATAATPAPVVAPTPAAAAAAVAPPAARPVSPAAATVPAAAAAAAPAVAAVPAPAPQRARDAAFFEEQEQRLRTLKRLRDNNLISEEEFQQKRREVLEKL